MMKLLHYNFFMYIYKDDMLLRKSLWMEVPKESVVVFCHPYTFNPQLSLKRAMKVVRYLREIGGYKPFSPILHSHHYHKYWKKQDTSFDDKYVEWDIFLYTNFFHPTFLFSNDWKISSGCKKEMDAIKENYSLYFLNIKEIDGLF